MRRTGVRARLALAVSSCVLLGACRESAPPPEVTSPVHVTLQSVRTDSIRDVVSAAGTVVPSIGGDLLVSAPEAATIAALPVKEGDKVAAGDLLVRFDVPSVTQLVSTQQMAVAAATGKRDQAKNDEAHLEDLFGRGLTSRNTLDASKAVLQSAETALDQAASGMDLAKIAEDATIIHARFSGVVVKVWHAAGDAVTPGSSDPVLRVVDPSRVQVSAQVDLQTLTRIEPKQTATITTTTDNQPRPATVAMKPPSTDAAAKTGEVRLTFDAPTSLPLDTPVAVDIMVEERVGALVVPAAAVAKDAEGPYVMTAGADGLAHRRPVRTGVVSTALAQIADGLKVGDQVIVGGLADVGEGTPITTGSR